MSLFKKKAEAIPPEEINPKDEKEQKEPVNERKHREIKLFGKTFSLNRLLYGLHPVGYVISIGVLAKKLFKKILHNPMTESALDIVKIGKLEFIVITCFSIAFSGLTSAYSYICSSHYGSMVLTLNYDGAKSGLTPTGSRFDISRILEEDFLEKVIEKADDKSLTPEFLKSRLYIDSKMPKSAIDNIISTIQSGTTYSYSPAEFTISYSQKDKLGKNYTLNVLSAMAECYTEDFYEKYSTKNYILEYDGDTDYSDYDYEEICQVLTDTISSMMSYLSSQRSENASFVSTYGYTYSDMINKLVNVRDVLIDKLDAHIMMNQVSKNREGLLHKYSYLIDEKNRTYNYQNDSSNIVTETLYEYDGNMTGVVFVPSVDEVNEYYMGRTKTGLDDLVVKAYSHGTSAIGVKKTIDDYTDIYTRFEAAPESTSWENAEVERQIAEIQKDLANISDMAIELDEEFQENLTNRYISFEINDPATFPVMYAIKMLIVGVILAYAASKTFDALCSFLIKNAGEDAEGEGKEEALA